MNLVLIVFPYLCCRSIACDVAPQVFDMFLEKTKLKDDSSNDADWVRDLRIILIAAQNNYVLYAGRQTCCRRRCRRYECFCKLDMMTTR